MYGARTVWPRRVVSLTCVVVTMASAGFRKRRVEPQRWELTVSSAWWYQQRVAARWYLPQQCGSA